MSGGLTTTPKMQSLLNSVNGLPSTPLLATGVSETPPQPSFLQSLFDNIAGGQDVQDVQSLTNAATVATGGALTTTSPDTGILASVEKWLSNGVKNGLVAVLGVILIVIGLWQLSGKPRP